MRLDYLLWLTNRGRCIHPPALEIRGEKLVSEGRGVISHHIWGTCRCVSLWNPILDFSYSHNSSQGKLHNSPLQDTRLLQDWGHLTQIRAFRRAFQTFRKLNSAYWDRENSRFGQWEYFNNRREDLFVGQAEDASWDLETLFSTSQPGGRIVWSSYKI